MLKLISKTIMIFLILSSLSHAVTLNWDNNPDADYYIIYYGTAPSTYTINTPNIPGNEIQYTIEIPENTTYYFAIKAFNSCGNSSDFSEEISHSNTPSSVTYPDSIIFEGKLYIGTTEKEITITWQGTGPQEWRLYDINKKSYSPTNQVVSPSATFKLPRTGVYEFNYRTINGDWHLLENVLISGWVPKPQGGIL